MRKFLLIIPAALLLPACSSPEPTPAAQITPITTAPATVESTPISNDEAEEAVIQGYISSARDLIARGVIPRDRVTTPLILSELTYLDNDQAERVKEAILS